MAVIAIDIGTQSLKAIVVDHDLNIRGSHGVPYQPSFPRSGWAEQDPQLWLDAMRCAISKAVSESGLRAGDIRVLSITGQLDGCLPVNREGNALAPAMIWMDRRATAEIASIDPAWIRDRTGSVLDATHMGAKIRWFANHLDRVEHITTWHQPVSFVVAALTGRNVIDHSQASTTMLYDLRQRNWSDDLLHAFDIDIRQLPDIAEAHEIAGEVTKSGAELTGLCSGTRVVVGTSDDFTGAIGAGVVAPGRISCSLGTAEVTGVVSDTCRIDQDALVETHGFPGGRYFLENPGWLAGGAVTWFCSTFGVASAGEMSALAARARPGCDGLLFLPALSGAMAPRWNASARGAFYGLTPLHGREACARAVLEGCAFAMRDVVDRLVTMGGPVSTIRLSGGGSSSDLWASIRADVSGLPVNCLTNPDATPIGAAMLALPAAGIADSLESAVTIMNSTTRTFEPDTGRQITYHHAYERYRALFETLTPMFEEDLT